MQYHVYQENPSNQYPIVILIKESAWAPNLIMQHYVQPLVKLGVNLDSIITVALPYNGNNKCPAKFGRSELEHILGKLATVGAKHLLVADPTYFKLLTKVGKTEPHHGYIVPCVQKDHESLDCILSVNYQALFHNPTMQSKIDMSVRTMADYVRGNLKELGSDIIHDATFIHTEDQLEDFLHKLLKKAELTCDIETKSLELRAAGVSTIGFSWSQHAGGAAAIDRHPGDALYAERDFHWRKRFHNLLREFFEQYRGTLIYHNAIFDIKVLIFNLFMNHPLDRKGLITGLKTMFRNPVEDTKIITYLATNTTAGNVLGLKPNTFEFAGNYAVDTEDTTKVPLPDLLNYNLIDCLCTWYLRDKYEQKMIDDNQLEIHDRIFIPSIKVITHMELVGMPQNRAQVDKVTHEMQDVRDKYMDLLGNSSLMQSFELQQAKIAMMEKNLLLKKKVKPIEDFLSNYNPNSPKQTQALVYDYMGFPVEEKTDTGQPSTGNKTLKRILATLMNQHNITEDELE